MASKLIIHGVLFSSMLVTPAVYADTKICYAEKITASALNVRTGPSTGNSKVGVIHSGELYVKTGKASGEWREIFFDENTRWIYAGSYTDKVEVPCGVVTASQLNVRSGPSTYYRKVGTAEKNSHWVVVDTSGSWAKIWYESEARWVHGSYLNQQPPIPNIELTAFSINNGAQTTQTRYVSLSSSYGISTAVSYRVSESANFNGAPWVSYANPIEFTLSDGAGTKTVYMQLKNEHGRLSNVRSDAINFAPPPPPPPITGSGYEIDRYTFFNQLRAAYGALSQSQVDGINYLLANMEEDTRPAINNKTVWQRQLAYVWSTVKHEVANTYQPITEYGSTYCHNYDGGCTYKGRGYVQLTHRYNYKKMSSVVGVDLVAYPTKALEPNIAYTVMSHGMFYGVFTGRALGDYVKAGVTDYYNARRVVNGTDKASLLAGYAKTFQAIMEKSTKTK